MEMHGKATESIEIASNFYVVKNLQWIIRDYNKSKETDSLYLQIH